MIWVLLQKEVRNLKAKVGKKFAAKIFRVLLFSQVAGSWPAVFA